MALDRHLHGVAQTGREGRAEARVVDRDHDLHGLAVRNDDMAERRANWPPGGWCTRGGGDHEQQAYERGEETKPRQRATSGQSYVAIEASRPFATQQYLPGVVLGHS